MKKQLIAALVALVAFTVGFVCLATGEKVAAAPMIAASITATISLYFI